MINAPPGDDAARFHNRQPGFLDRDRADTWFDLTADPASILTGPPAGTFVAAPPEPVAV
jgi:putative SOS response-associated peptidase YedK